MLFRSKKIRLLTFLVVAAMLLAVTAGCQPAATTAPTTTTSAPTGTTATGQPTEPTGIQLPLTDTPVTYKLFVPVNRAEQDYATNEIWNKISDLTGIQFEWENPTVQAGQDRLTLMLASQQYPDIIATNNQVQYPGGMEAAVDENVFIDHKALIEQHAPLYWEILSNNPDALRDSLTDKGYIPALYEVYLKDASFDINTGIWCNVTRADWLEDLNLEVPETIDEWYTALKAFKEEKGATFPLLWMLGRNPIFAQAYGIVLNPISASGTGSYQNFYPDANGKIHYGGIEEGYRDYLITLSKWYAEGLFDRDYNTRAVFDLPLAATLFGTGQAGVTGGYLAWTSMYESNATDPNFEIAVCPTPVLNKGDKGTMILSRPEFLGFQRWSITTQCENPELFVQLINYLASDEGRILTNYGIEGTHHTMVNGNPTLTDLITKDNMGPFDAREVIIGNFNPINLILKENLTRQVYNADILEAAAIPSDSTDLIYLSFALSLEEANELSDVFADIHTYVAESYDRAVMNPEVAASWMEVQAAQIRNLGIDRAIEIVQTAYDRYMNR